jgi:hypothetical protein
MMSIQSFLAVLMLNIIPAVDPVTYQKFSHHQWFLLPEDHIVDQFESTNRRKFPKLEVSVSFNFQVCFL